VVETSFDVVVIGGGPGGYPAAIRASQLGMKVALVEREHLGGVCLNWGCIPTKALLRSSDLYHLLQRLDEYGVSAGDVRFDIAKAVKRSRQVSRKLAGGVKHLLRKNEVAVFDGCGALDGAGSVRVERDGAEGTVLRAARAVVVATGARPRSIPGLEPDGRLIWTYREALTPEAVPGSLLVIGSGAVGIEFASFYRDLGVEVTMVELLPRILPLEDEEVSALAHKQLEKRGMALYPEAAVSSLERGEERVVATLAMQGGETRRLEVDRAILAVGVVGNVEGVGLETTAVQIRDGYVVVNDWCETGEPGVYAVGDVAGPPCLAHKATHQGLLCAEHIAGAEDLEPLDTGRIPSCVYGRPQIASVGLTETQARERGAEPRVGRFPLAANGKAVALGETDGFVKTVFDAGTGELLGAHMIGAEVTELIQGFVLAMGLETTEAELMRAVFPHPSLSEAMHESVLAAFGRALHI
jgi:dihydrolipoamide dehydrogenase